MTCDRCKTKTSATIMSMFNTEQICPKCKGLERQHPKYMEACKAELAAVEAGNTNYDGIGKPDDL